MKTITAAIISALAISACGAGSEGYPVPGSQGVADNQACSSSFYSNLTGEYSGLLERDGGSFYTFVSIDCENGYQFGVDLDIEIITIAADPVNFTDIDTVGTLTTSIDGLEYQWAQPSYPVDGRFELVSTPEPYTTTAYSSSQLYSDNAGKISVMSENQISINATSGILTKI